MSRYRLTISCEFDTEKDTPLQSDEARALIIHTCPHNFNLRSNERCSMTDCFSCWYKALEEGVKNGCKSVHVKRLD